MSTVLKRLPMADNEAWRAMLRILNTSFVVTAEAHNPSILHPSFLAGQHIVPDDWPLAEPPLCTPVLSVVKFANSIAITVEPQKLQVIDNGPPSDPRRSEIPGIVEQYTRMLPHVRYTGIGVNVSGFVETADAAAILHRFLAPGAWNAGALQPQSVGIRFVYRALDMLIRVALDAGTVQTAVGGEVHSGVVIAANYHVDVVPEAEMLEQISTATRRFVECCDHFRQMIGTILNLESEHAAR
jgi:hypothetical protein